MTVQEAEAQIARQGWSVTAPHFAVESFHLKGDSFDPGRSMLYGTDDSGKRGWYSHNDRRSLFTATQDGGPNGVNTRVSLFGGGVGSLIVPSNSLIPGKTIPVQARGRVSVAAGSTFTIAMRLAATDYVTLLVNTGPIVNRGFLISGMLTCRTNGVGGTGIAQLDFAFNLGTYVCSNVILPIAINTTIPLAFDLTAQYSAVDAGNILVCTNAIVESVG